jgi:hypothetical protein
VESAFTRTVRSRRPAAQWAAYHGEHRLEIGKSKRTLCHKYLDLRTSRDELVVVGFRPEIPDVIDGEELLELSGPISQDRKGRLLCRSSAVGRTRPKRPTRPRDWMPIGSGMVPTRFTRLL